MNRISLCLFFYLSGIAGSTLHVRGDEPARVHKPIVIDNAPPELRDVTSRLWSVAFSLDGNTLAVTAGWDNPREPGELVLWDVKSGREKLIWRQEKNIPTLAYSPRGTRLAIGDFAGSTKILDPSTGKTIVTLTTSDTQLVNSVAFSAKDGTLLTGSFGGIINQWDIETGKNLHTFSLPGEMVVAIAVSFNGSHLAAATWHGKAHVWDLPKRKKLYTLEANRSVPREANVVQAIDFAPDGKTFVTGCWDTTLRLWQTADGKAIRDFQGHTTAVLNAAFSPDGKTMASTDRQGNVMLWNPTTGKRVAEWAAHTAGRSYGLGFSPDGKQLATTGRDHKAKIWDIKTRKLIASFTRARSIPREP